MGQDLIGLSTADSQPNRPGLSTVYGAMAWGIELGPNNTGRFGFWSLITDDFSPTSGWLSIVGNPIKMSRVEVAGAVSAPSRIASPGEHTREILRSELGMTESEIDDLIASKVIGTTAPVMR